MSLRLQAALEGSLTKIMGQELHAAERAVMLGVRQATGGLKLELREQVLQAGLGRKLANTWRGNVYPKGGTSLNAAGFVFSKAPQVIGAFGTGVVIHSRKGAYLAIPTEAAGKAAMGKRITPSLWEQAHGQRLRFVYRRGAASLLVADNMRARRGKRGGFSKASASALRRGRGLTTVPMFFLVPQVSIKKRFDIDSAGRKWVDRLPHLVLQNWEEGAS